MTIRIASYGEKDRQGKCICQMLTSVNGLIRLHEWSNKVFNIGKMFGYIIPNDKGKTVVSNRIFETRLYNFFTSKDESSKIYSLGSIDKNQFIKNGQIDMDHLLTRFSVHFNEIYNQNDDAF